jgi:hypothetical protein
VEEEPGEIVEPAEQRRPEERAEGHFDAIPRGIVQIGTVLAALALSGAGATAFCLLPSYPSVLSPQSSVLSPRRGHPKLGALPCHLANPSSLASTGPYTV